MNGTDDWMGPVGYLVTQVPPGADVQGGFTLLRELVDDATLAVLDLEVLAPGADGPEVLDAATWSVEAGLDLGGLVATCSGLLDSTDRAVATQGLPDGGVAVVVVYEALSAHRVAQAWERGGAVVIDEDSLDVEDLAAVLDASPEHEGNPS